MKKKVLIIDDDLSVCKEIKYALQNEVTDVYYATSVQDALEQLVKHQYCLVIMDIFFSNTDGYALLKMIRQTKPMPILALSSSPEHTGKILALKAGANSYMGKPYELEECLAQAQSLMQLYMELYGTEQRCYTLVCGMGLLIDPMCRQATLMGEPLELTRKEFEMLFCFANHAGQVLSREQLYSQIWNNDENYNIDEIVKSHIKSLRKKLTPSGKEYIKNVWGVGYYFNSEPEDTLNKTDGIVNI